MSMLVRIGFGGVALLGALLLASPAVAQPTCDVRALGASGNGITDDTAAINVALGTPSLCGTVVFPPGNYRVTGPLVIRGDRIIQGSGKGRTIVSSASSTADVFSMTGSASTGRLTIRDLTIGVAPGTVKTTGVGILVSEGFTQDYQADGGRDQRRPVQRHQLAHLVLARGHLRPQ
jgi:Pectate lyase superfamily protein